MASITINGRSISGASIQIRGHQILVDGRSVDGVDTAGGVLEVRIVEGRVNNITADGYVTCGAVEGDVSAGGYVRCGAVGGDVSAGGYVQCGDVAGDVSAGGYIRRG